MKCPHCDSENVKVIPPTFTSGLAALMFMITFGAFFLLVFFPLGIIFLLFGVPASILIMLRGLQMKGSKNPKHKNNAFCKTCHKPFFWDGERALKQKEMA